LKRKLNEDSVVVRTERGYWAVADGMGGHEAGDVASQKVRDALQSLPVVYALGDLVDSAVAALKRVNRELIELARSGSKETIGTTVVGLAISGNEFRCFWAGDSRAYRIRAGAIEQLSRDHSLVQSLVDAGMIAPTEAVDHPNANIITRAVGVGEDLQVDVIAGEVIPGDQFLLATDGLTRMVSDGEVAAVLAATTPAEAADRLVALVLERGAPDNVSLVLTTVC
jgi:serine/threonine-protein phosphatase Stp1